MKKSAGRPHKLPYEVRKVIAEAVVARETTYRQAATKYQISVRESGIHRSDQGSQYRSHEYVKYLKECRFRVSMSDKGCPTQNAFIETFFKTLKYEQIYF
ncbi:MAG: transposase InsO family protein [Bacteriovoracaceae bacterium]|jgi:transposase InsO family protein